MMRSLFSAVSGLKTNQTAMDVIGNNVANVNTIGFKSSRVVFQDVYSQTLSTATAPTETTGGINPQQVGLGVTISAIGLNMTEGSMQPSSNPLDFAITGEGFFVIRGSDGAYYYTRNGAFTLDAEGYLVTANGDYVMGVSGNAEAVANGNPLYDAAGNPIFDRIKIVGSIPTGETDATENPSYETYSDYAVDSNGVVTAINSSGEVVTIGRLVLATFNNTGGLQKEGNSYYSETSNSGEAEIHFVNVGCGSIKSGYLEMSNVDLATELTNMIITQRGYQVNARVITTSDSMLEELINLKR